SLLLSSSHVSFYTSLTPPDQQSFPTRRSSDLLLTNRSRSITSRRDFPKRRERSRLFFLIKQLLLAKEIFMLMKYYLEQVSTPNERLIHFPLSKLPFLQKKRVKRFNKQ